MSASLPKMPILGSDHGHKKRALRYLRDHLASDLVQTLRIVPNGRELMLAMIDREAERDALTVVFQWHGQDEQRRDVFTIGRVGDVRKVVAVSRGVWIVWWAIHNCNDPRGLDTSTLVDPDATQPDASVRRMVRVQAIKQFRALDLPELECAALACHVSAGRVRYAPTGKVITVITAPSSS